MHPLLISLRELSETAVKVLPLLEKYDYREEAYTDMEKHISLDELPMRLREVVDSVLKYCCPLPQDTNPLPQASLLNKDNMQMFIQNLRITGDTSLAHQCKFIELEPIKAVSGYFEELGLKNQSHLLDNVYEFGIALRSSSRNYGFGSQDSNQPPIQINFTVPPNELSEQELVTAQKYSEFCRIFKGTILSSSQKRALYDAFLTVLTDKSVNKPHLVIMTALILLQTRRMYGKPLSGTLNSVRQIVFTSLDLPATTAKSYRLDSIKKGVTQSLYNYKQQATDLLERALRNTR